MDEQIPGELSSKIDEILQMLRRIETEMHVLRGRFEQVGNERPLEPLEKVAD